MRLQGKTALAPGGSRGIGRACTERLAAEGARVAFLYHHSQEAADSLVAELRDKGHEVKAIQADVVDTERAEKVVADLLADWKQIDILVNSARVIPDGLFATIGPDQWHSLIATNP